jgi:hypothetical protein
MIGQDALYSLTGTTAMFFRAGHRRLRRNCCRDRPGIGTDACFIHY